MDGNLPLHFEEQHLSIILSFNNERLDQHFTWLLRFNTQEVYLRMNNAFTQGIFEASNGLGSWQKLKPDEQRYNRDAYTDDVEMADAEPYYPEDEEEEEEQPPQQEFEEELYSEEEEEEESEESESEQEPGKKNKAKNSLLAVGYKGMSFVVRGDMIGVFENQKGTGKKLKVSPCWFYVLVKLIMPPVLLVHDEYFWNWKTRFKVHLCTETGHAAQSGHDHDPL